MRNTFRTVFSVVLLLATSLLFANSVYAQPKCIGQVATIIGTTKDDVINGTPGPDVIVGLAGNDTINGFGGDDLICGGKGRDLIKGGGGNDSLFGGPGADILRGNAGDDHLDGGGGNDVNNGGLGFDECLDEIGINTFLACDATCQSFSLNTDFSDRGFFFVDSVNSVLIGLTSNGSDVVVVMSDIPDDGTKIGGFVFQVKDGGCNIASGSVDLDMDGSFNDEKILPASGTCSLESDGTEFVLQDFVLNHVPLGGDLKAICGSIPAPLSFSDKGAEQISIDDLTNALTDAMISFKQELSENFKKDIETIDTENSVGFIEEFQQKLEK